MYAIIRTGGKQAKVREGDVIDVERIKGSDTVTFTPLLLVQDDGSVVSERDVLAKATVTAEILSENRGPKVDVFKYKAKTGYRRSQGHRQTYSRLQITKIDGPGAKKAPAKKTAAKKAAAEKAAAEKAAAEKAPATKSTTKKAAATKSTTKKAPAKKTTATKAKADAPAEDTPAAGEE